MPLVRTLLILLSFVIADTEKQETTLLNDFVWWQMQTAALSQPRRGIAGKIRYTLARKGYIHKKFVFGIDFPINYISVTRKYFSWIDLPKITYHIFAGDSENYMEKWFGKYFLGKSHFIYMKQCFRNWFRNNFWLECMSEIMWISFQMQRQTSIFSPSQFREELGPRRLGGVSNRPKKGGSCFTVEVVTIDT